MLRFTHMYPILNHKTKVAWAQSDVPNRAFNIVEQGS